MKKIIFLFSFLIIINSCTDQESIIEVEKNKLMANVYFSKYNFITGNFMRFRGFIIGETLFDLTSVRINDSTVNFDTYENNISSTKSAMIEFWTPLNEYLTFIGSGKFEINTSIGKLEGYFEFPDSIRSVNYNMNVGDTLREGDKLEISFEGKADFYILHYLHQRGVWGDSGYFSIEGRMISKENKFIVDQNILNKSGHIWIADIISVNGPDITQPSYGNMTGSGTGFLYTDIKKQIMDKFFIKLD